MSAELESIRLAMDEAWRDHQHTREQTWKALQIEFALAAGTIGSTWSLDSLVAQILGALFVLLVTLCGIQITLRHRNRVEVTKFRHIMNCEEALGLHSENLISGVKMPGPISIGLAFNPFRGNTSLFILRMHLAILVFTLLYFGFRIFTLLF